MWGSVVEKISPDKIKKKLYGKVSSVWVKSRFLYR